MRGGGRFFGSVGAQYGTFSEATLAPDDPTDCFDARAILLPGRAMAPLDHVAIAIVDKALRDFRMYGRAAHPRRRIWFENARAFLFDADVDVDWPLTFERICDRFGLDVDTARAAIREQSGSVRRVRLRSRRAA